MRRGTFVRWKKGSEAGFFPANEAQFEGVALPDFLCNCSPQRSV